MAQFGLSLPPPPPPPSSAVVFEQLAEKHLPELYQLLKYRLQILAMISLSWFLTLFFSVMDSSTAIIILDCFFVDGAKVHTNVGHCVSECTAMS